MENNKKRKGISFLDILLIIMLLGVAALAFMYFKSGGFKKGDKIVITYVVEFQKQKKGYGNFVTEGNDVKDSIKGYRLGTIINVETKPSTEYGFSENNVEFVKTESPFEEDILVTVKADGYQTGDSVSTGDVDLRIGKEMFLEGKGFVLARGYIIAINTEEKEAE